MELIEIYIVPELGMCHTSLIQTPMGPSENILLLEMRDLLLAYALGSVFKTLIAVWALCVPSYIGGDYSNASCAIYKTNKKRGQIEI